MGKRKLTACRVGRVLVFLGPLLFAAMSATFANDISLSDNPLVDASQVPSFTGAYLSGQVADFDHNYDLAIEFYQRALQFEPDNVDAKRRLFSALIIAGYFEQAVELAETLQGDQDVATLSDRTLVVNSIQQREYRRAETLVDLTEMNPVENLLNNLLSAWAKFGDKRIDEAFAQVDAMEGPTWYAPFKDYNSGLMAAAHGDLDKAHAHFDDLIGNNDAIQITPDTYLQTVMAKAILYYNSGETDKALATLTGNVQAAYPPARTLERIIRQDGKISNPVSSAQQGASAAFFAIGAALNRAGNEDIVALYLQFSRALDPENAAALVMLAGLKEQLDQPEKAIEIYRTVPQTSAVKRLADLQLGLNLADIGQIDQALSHIAALIADNPQDIRAYTSYGSILSSEMRYREMADNYEAAIKAFGPLHSRAHWNLFYQLGIAYERLKIWDKAEVAFLRSLELSPNQPQVMNYLGYSWIDMNINLDRGMDMIRAAVDLRPDDGYIVDSLGWAYYRLGQYDNAVRELERAVVLRPADPTINDHLGDAFWKVGRFTEAKFQWERALSNIDEFDENLIPAIEEKLENGLSD